MPRRGLAITVQPSIDLAKLNNVLLHFPGKLFPVMHDNVEETFDLLVGQMQKRSAEGPLYKRSGKLRQSWRLAQKGNSLRNYEAMTGSYADYSVKHELGGFYEPTRARFFWIPIGPNIKLKNRKAVVSPAKARNLIEQGKWRYAGQKKDPGTPKGTPRKKTLILNENGVPVYILVTRIYLPPRLGFQHIAPIFVRRAHERLTILSMELAARGMASIKH